MDAGPYHIDDQALYPLEDLGRIGVIRFEEQEHERLAARFEIVPERFRVAPEVTKRIDRFTGKQQADIEIRV